MSEKRPSQSADTKATFEEAARAKSRGIVGEFFDFLLTSKKWWLTPIIVFLLLIGALVLLSSSGAVAPFIYTLF